MLDQLGGLKPRRRALFSDTSKGRGDRLIRPIRLRSGQDFRTEEVLNRHGPAGSRSEPRLLEAPSDRHERQHVSPNAGSFPRRDVGP